MAEKLLLCVGQLSAGTSLSNGGSLRPASGRNLPPQEVRRDNTGYRRYAIGQLAQTRMD
jgi:hypothetical protein